MIINTMNVRLVNRAKLNDIKAISKRVFFRFLENRFFKCKLDKPTITKNKEKLLLSNSYKINIPDNPNRKTSHLLSTFFTPYL